VLEALMCLQFGYIIYWQKEINAKAAHKMLVKLITEQTRGKKDIEQKGLVEVNCFSVKQKGCFSL